MAVYGVFPLPVVFLLLLLTLGSSLGEDKLSLGPLVVKESVLEPVKAYEVYDPLVAAVYDPVYESDEVVVRSGWVKGDG